MRTLLVALMVSVSGLGLLAPREAYSQTQRQQPAGYKKGDKVLVQWAGKSVAGEVIAKVRGGFYQVQFSFNGIELKPTLPPQLLKPAPKKPGKGTKPKTGARPGTPGQPDGGFGTTVKSNTGADWSDVRNIVPVFSGAWRVRVQATRAARDRFTTKPILLQRQGAGPAVFQQLTSVLFSREKSRAIAVVINRLPGTTKPITLHPLDLIKGKTSPAMPLPLAEMPVDLSADGKLLLSRSDLSLSGVGLGAPGNIPGGKLPSVGLPTNGFGQARKCQVTVWKLGSPISKELSWDPEKTLPSGFTMGAPPVFSAFIDAQRVLTVCLPGSMTLWDTSATSKAKAVYTLDLVIGGVPAVSPDRRLVAVPALTGGVFVLNALTGETLGRLAGAVAQNTTLSFRPDGKQLAAVSPKRLQVWDTDTGKRYRDIYFSKTHQISEIDWVADGYLLVGGENLVDLERRIVLWQYQHTNAIFRTAHRTSGELGGIFWYGLTSKDRSAMGLFQTKLPHAEARQMASSLKPDELLAVKPGTTVSLSVKIKGSAAERQSVRDALNEQLRRLGIRVGSGRVVLEATTETGETRKLEYKSFGSTTGETVRVTDQISRLKLVEDGRPIWDASLTTSAPFILSRKRGQSIQTALAPYQKPNLKFFSEVRIPRYVARPNDKGAYGASELSYQGVKPATIRSDDP